MGLSVNYNILDDLKGADIMEVSLNLDNENTVKLFRDGEYETHRIPRSLARLLYFMVYEDGEEE